MTESNAPSDQPGTVSLPVEYRKVLRTSKMVRVVLSEERWQLFLKKLRETGLINVAAQVASPHLDPSHCTDKRKRELFGSGQVGLSTFRSAIKRDPRRQAEYEDALAAGQAVLEQLARERCEIPDTRPILDRMGKIVGEEKRYESSNRMILRTLAKLDNSWSEKRDISGNIQHKHSVQSNGDGIFFPMDEVGLLSNEDQDMLFALVERLQIAKEANAETESGQPALPAPSGAIIPYIEGEVVDGNTLSPESEGGLPPDEGQGQPGDGRGEV